ncbi:C39 family peptidase [Rummeliibacillus pycnus]|uniref:C39 family peptidase n=1 Tax=Rummeliibacillus pycnus TaxID=101070 RepID=UPI0037C9F7C8
MNFCLNMPRFGQHFEEGDWPENTLVEGKGADYWGESVCGLACIRMIMGHYQIPVATAYDLLNDGIHLNAYCEKGWIHQGLANIAAKYGLSAKPIALQNGEELEKLLKNYGPVIVSVTGQLPEDGRKGGHLIVACGRHKEKGEYMISFRDPSKWGKSNSIVSEKRFLASFTGRGIVFM